MSFNRFEANLPLLHTYPKNGVQVVVGSNPTTPTSERLNERELKVGGVEIASPY